MSSRQYWNVRVAILERVKKGAYRLQPSGRINRWAETACPGEISRDRT